MPSESFVEVQLARDIYRFVFAIAVKHNLLQFNQSILGFTNKNWRRVKNYVDMFSNCFVKIVNACMKTGMNEDEE